MAEGAVSKAPALQVDAEESGQRETMSEQPHAWLANAGSCGGIPGIVSESPRHTQQTKTKAMAAQMHNPTPAIAQDTPTYAKVTINATQASTRRTLIGHLYRRRIRAGMIQLPWIVQGQTGILRVLGKRQSRERATDAVMS